MTRGRRSPRRAPRLAGALALALVVSTACTHGSGDADESSGPPRLTPQPDRDLASSLATVRASTDAKLDACALLAVGPLRVAQLTGATLPDTPPSNPGDLSAMCTYGGPGTRPTPTTAAAPTTAGAEDGSVSGDGQAAPTTPGTVASSTTRPSPARATTSRNEPADQDGEADDGTPTPDSVTAAAVRPAGDVRAALALQPEQLRTLYRCSSVRGQGAVPGAQAQPGAPAEVKPQLATSYVDCSATPTGGGTEVHTVLVAGRELWHLALIKPGTPRTPQSELDALAGLHRLAAELLD